MSLEGRRFVSLSEYARRHRPRVHEGTIRNWVERGYFPVYKLPGVRGVHVDFDEAEAALAALPEGKLKSTYGTFGPDARVVDLSKVIQ